MDHVNLAAQKVARDPSRIILLAVEAQDAELDYGYLIPKHDMGQFDPDGVWTVASFIEKPSVASLVL